MIHDNIDHSRYLGCRDSKYPLSPRLSTERSVIKVPLPLSGNPTLLLLDNKIRLNYQVVNRIHRTRRT